MPSLAADRSAASGGPWFPPVNSAVTRRDLAACVLAAYDARHAPDEPSACTTPFKEQSTMTQRINYMQQSPELFRKFIEFNTLVKDSVIEEPIRDLVAIRASQLNGCAFCLDMHVKQAKIHGERELRIHHLSVWRESTLFIP